MDRGLIDQVTRWLVFRQTLYEDEDVDVDEQTPDSETNGRNEDSLTKIAQNPSAALQAEAKYPVKYQVNAVPTLESHMQDLSSAGFNGRCNKVADTCYAWWVGGTLSVRIHSLSLKPASIAIQKRFL